MSKAEEILERQKQILEAIRSGEDCSKEGLMKRFGKNGKPLSLRSLNSDIEALKKQGFSINSKKGVFMITEEAAAVNEAPAPAAEDVFEHSGRKTLRDLYLLHLVQHRGDKAGIDQLVADYTRHKDQDSIRISATNLGAELHESTKAALSYTEKPEVLDSLDRLAQNGMLIREDETFTLTSAAPRRLSLTEDETLRLLQRIHFFGGAYSFSDELKSIADRLSLAFYREVDSSAGEFRTVGFRRIRMPEFEKNMEKLRGIPFSTRSLRITYQSGDIERTFSFLTGLFFYAADKRRLYLIGKEPGKEYDTTLVCSRIVKITPEDAENPLFQNRYYRKMYDEMFSVSTEPAEKVKVEFERVFNVEEKLNRLLRTRPCARITRKEDTILYEDTIRGMTDFFKYLRGFGRSVRILEPASLRELALQSAERILERYTETEVNQ